MTIVLLPLLGFILSFFARYLGKEAGCRLSILSVGLAFLNALIMCLKVCIGRSSYSYNFDWIIFNTFNLKFTFLLDPLTSVMALLITLITLLVMIYSYGYLNEDPSLVKFLSYLSFFAFTMLTLVTGGNYVQMFIGWEGVGLASYFLISFWNTRNEATKGGLKAVVVNRIGDVFFMFALALMWTLFKSFDFGTIFSIYPSILEENIRISVFGMSVSLTTLLTVCLLIAASAKSAQLILHTWLPDAMEGPTPVSSLLHSATMVTAGVFLIIRSSFFFSFVPNVSLMMACLGVLTALVSGLIGLMQSDLKKIIAYSTCSQLGFMVTACGLGYYNFALFHLVTHAFFKCLLFLCSGSIIHAVGDEQDIRKMGALYNYLPITFVFMGIGNLALCGFPFLAGFFSKDLLLETAFISGKLGFTIFLLLSFAAFLTAVYSFRAFYFTFFGASMFPKSLQSSIHESPQTMLIPMAILTFFAAVSGYFFVEFFTGPTGLLILRNTISNTLYSALFEFETELGSFKLLPTIVSLLGIFVSYIVFSTDFFLKYTLFFYTTINLFAQKFYFDKLYNRFLGLPILHFAYNISYKLLDRGFFEIYGWFANILKVYIWRARRTSNGYLSNYIILLTVSVVNAVICEFADIDLATTLLFGYITLITTMTKEEFELIFPTSEGEQRNEEKYNYITLANFPFWALIAKEGEPIWPHLYINFTCCVILSALFIIYIQRIIPSYRFWKALGSRLPVFCCVVLSCMLLFVIILHMEDGERYLVMRCLTLLSLFFIITYIISVPPQSNSVFWKLTIIHRMFYYSFRVHIYMKRVHPSYRGLVGLIMGVIFNFYIFTCKHVITGSFDPTNGFEYFIILYILVYLVGFIIMLLAAGLFTYTLITEYDYETHPLYLGMKKLDKDKKLDYHRRIIYTLDEDNQEI